MTGPIHTPNLKPEPSDAEREAGLAAMEAILNSVPDSALASPSFEAVRALLAQNYLGPEVWRTVFGANLNLREVPALPAGLLEILNEDCKFKPGKKVHETHLLVFVPETVNGEALTVNSLKARAGDALFWKHDRPDFWFQGEPFANTGAKGHWALIPKYLVPGSLGKDYPEQTEILKSNHHQYETAKALDLITALVINKLNGGDNGDYVSIWGWCSDKTELADNLPGARVDAGNFGASGLDVYRVEESYRLSGLGRAASRKFH